MKPKLARLSVKLSVLLLVIYLIGVTARPSREEDYADSDEEYDEDDEERDEDELEDDDDNDNDNENDDNDAPSHYRPNFPALPSHVLIAEAGDETNKIQTLQSTVDYLEEFVRRYIAPHIDPNLPNDHFPEWLKKPIKPEQNPALPTPAPEQVFIPPELPAKPKPGKGTKKPLPTEGIIIDKINLHMGTSTSIITPAPSVTPTTAAPTTVAPSAERSTIATLAAIPEPAPAPPMEAQVVAKPEPKPVAAEPVSKPEVSVQIEETKPVVVEQPVMSANLEMPETPVVEKQPEIPPAEKQKEPTPMPVEAPQPVVSEAEIAAQEIELPVPPPTPAENPAPSNTMPETVDAAPAALEISAAPVAEIPLPVVSEMISETIVEEQPTPVGLLTPEQLLDHPVQIGSEMGGVAAEEITIAGQNAEPTVEIQPDAVPLQETLVDVPVEVPVEAPVDPLVEAPVEPLVEAPVEPLVEAPLEPLVETPVEPLVETAVPQESITNQVEILEPVKPFEVTGVIEEVIIPAAVLAETAPAMEEQALPDLAADLPPVVEVAPIVEEIAAPIPSPAPAPADLVPTTEQALPDLEADLPPSEPLAVQHPTINLEGIPIATEVPELMPSFDPSMADLYPPPIVIGSESVDPHMMKTPENIGASTPMHIPSEGPPPIPIDPAYLESIKPGQADQVVNEPQPELVSGHVETMPPKAPMPVETEPAVDAPHDHVDTAGENAPSPLGGFPREPAVIQMLLLEENVHPQARGLLEARKETPVLTCHNCTIRISCTDCVKFRPDLVLTDPSAFPMTITTPGLEITAQPDIHAILANYSEIYPQTRASVFEMNNVEATINGNQINVEQSSAEPMPASQAASMKVDKVLLVDEPAPVEIYNRPQAAKVANPEQMPQRRTMAGHDSPIRVKRAIGLILHRTTSKPLVE